MDIIKVIKRVNERMAVYQRQGLTDSTNYKKMKEKIELLGVPHSEAKGRFKISMKKADLSKIDPDDLAILDSMPSLKQERQQAKEQGYKTTQEQNQYIKNRGSLETWIENNMNYVYNDSMSGNDSALKLKELFKDGLRKVNYDKVFEYINKYEQEKEREFSMLHDSEFYDDDIF